MSEALDDRRIRAAVGVGAITIVHRDARREVRRLGVVVEPVAKRERDVAERLAQLVATKRAAATFVNPAVPVVEVLVGLDQRAARLEALGADDRPAKRGAHRVVDVRHVCKNGFAVAEATKEEVLEVPEHVRPVEHRDAEHADGVEQIRTLETNLSCAARAHAHARNRAVGVASRVGGLFGAGDQSPPIGLGPQLGLTFLGRLGRTARGDGKDG